RLEGSSPRTETSCHLRNPSSPSPVLSHPAEGAQLHHEPDLFAVLGPFHPLPRRRMSSTDHAASLRGLQVAWGAIELGALRMPYRGLVVLLAWILALSSAVAQPRLDVVAEGLEF